MFILCVSLNVVNDSLEVCSLDLLHKSLPFALSLSKRVFFGRNDRQLHPSTGSGRTVCRSAMTHAGGLLNQFVFEKRVEPMLREDVIAVVGQMMVIEIQ